MIARFKEVSKEIGSEHYVIFTVGEKRSEALNTLSNDKSIEMKNAYIGLGIHQYFDTISKLHLDYIAIPKAVVNNEAREKVINSIQKYTLTFAVPAANPTSEKLKKAYENWHLNNKPSLDKKYIIVMLPGDAPDNSGMRHFTQASTDKLFEGKIFGST